MSSVDKISKQQEVHHQIIGSFKPKLLELSQYTVHPSFNDAIVSYLNKRKGSSISPSSSSMHLPETKYSPNSSNNKNNSNSNNNNASSLVGGNIDSILNLSIITEELMYPPMSQSQSQSQGEAGSISSDNVRFSLLDIFNIDTEKGLCDRCNDVYHAIENGLNELKAIFNEVQLGMQQVEIELQNKNDLVETEIVPLLEMLERYSDSQKTDLDQLKASHLSVNEVVKSTHIHSYFS